MKIQALAQGVDGLFIKNDRFNTTLVSFNFYLPLNKDDMSLNALLPYVLTSCSDKFSTFTDLNLALNMLYGADLSVSVSKIGDAQLIKVAVAVINDEFSIGHEPVIKKAADLLMELIFKPRIKDNSFIAADIEREKRKVKEHILGEINDKRRYARKRLIAEMFEDSDYGISAYGTVEQLENITGENLYDAWQKLLKNAYVRVQLVGKNTPEGFFDKISEEFSKYDRVICDDYKKLSCLTKRENVKEVTEEMDVAQGKLVMGFSSEIWGNNAYALTVATDIFGGGTYSGLFENVRERLSLCYYCSASANKNKGYIMVDSGVEFANTEKARAEILNQLDIVKKGGFKQSTFDASIKNILNSLNSSYDSLGALDSWYCASIYSEQIKTPEDVAQIISSLDKKQIIEAANGIKLHTVYSLTGKKGDK